VFVECFGCVLLCLVYTADINKIRISCLVLYCPCQRREQNWLVTSQDCRWQKILKLFCPVPKCGDDYWKQSWLATISVHTTNKTCRRCELSFILQESNADRTAVEHSEQTRTTRLERLKEELDSEHQGRCEGLEKKYAYKMEHMRQEMADKHDQVNEARLLSLEDCSITLII